MRLFTFSLALVVLATAACSTPTAATTELASKRERVTLVERFTSLSEAVRAEPKITIQSGQAYLRSGINSVNSQQEVQFAVRGQIIGTLASAESIINLYDVERLRVLDASTAGARYGLQGSGGVVEVVMKDSRRS